MAKRTEGTTVEYTVEGEAVKQGDIITLDDGQEGVALQDGDEGETITLTIISGESGNDDGDEGRNNDGDDDEGRSNDGDDDGTSDGDDDEGKRSTRGKNKTRTAPPASKRSAKPKTPSEGRRMDEILLVTEAAGLPYEDAVELYRSNKTIEECREAVHKKAMEKQARSFNGGHSTVTVGRSGNEKMMNAMQGAILHRVLPGQFKLEGDAKDFRAYTVTDYARDLMAAHGINARTMTPAEVADAIFKRAYGTSDFPILMEGAIEKILLAPYQTEEECWDKISKPHTFRDFREKGFYRGDSENGMVERKEGAEIKYTTFIEGKETMRLRSFSQGIRLTREAIINDDLDVFSQIPQTFGNNWNELRGDLVWGVYTDNPKMSDGKSIFHADHKNTIELGLTAAGLSAARVQFRRQTKPGTNRPLKVSPKYLIVPPELETAAELLMAQITATETEKVNPFSKKYTILVESRLTDPKAWYLAADPNACTSVVHGYLDGSENLRVNTKENFDNDTIDYAVRGDFAAGAIDHRGILKSTGTK